ncbi:lipase [Gordonia amarae]|uniref:Lipase n=2 Tax=Gordonia amarae TaxID=36821 RepID=G7GUV0_9ACTN|nr:lipase family protein [Gordonia amarae]MCS3876937.1 hypothetical protein [Gordonia amarae]QHN15764.1 lipase [Gordonia amarae]QHN20333.1 lipase [Gordonia amarae]QHN29184.1 lipase [Gordonia amarae]QHN37963.1 lipase [Gordonia amarae]
MTAWTRAATVVAAVLAACALLTAPASAAPSEPGALLTFSKVGEQAFGMPGGRAAYTLTYLSRGAGNTLTPVRATAWIPTTKAPATGYPVTAYGHGTAGLGDSCTLANAFRAGGRSYGPYFGPWLKNGFLLVAPEYAGIDGPGVHPYLDGRVSGANLIDAVRAVRQLGAKVGVKVGREFTTSGGSQGGHASLFAGTMAPKYAPELTLIGTTAVAPPVHMDRYLAALGPYVPSLPIPDYVTYLSYVLRGLAVANPWLKVDAYLTPTGKSLLTSAETLCYPDQVKRSAGVGVGQMLTRSLGQGPLIRAVRQTQVVPVRGFRSPVLIHQGVFDVTAFSPLTELYVRDARAAGANIDYRRSTTGHDMGGATETVSAKWAHDRYLAGR